MIRGGFGVFYGSIVWRYALQQLSAPGLNGTILTLPLRGRSQIRPGRSVPALGGS